ncbi:hypothetical protein Pcinc_043574 [Petrolisthes cinctipes]|uniref:Uncharacterized protein n=1 Tax=Petrolisthes cinctipes TaxID=88211 RepID=A0AAE1BFN6_PETCI|nr:hypothetical protein Pcinc_043574 [Petrolisthes cinctipes]
MEGGRGWDGWMEDGMDGWVGRKIGRDGRRIVKLRNKKGGSPASELPPPPTPAWNSPTPSPASELPPPTHPSLRTPHPSPGTPPPLTLEPSPQSWNFPTLTPGTPTRTNPEAPYISLGTPPTPALEPPPPTSRTSPSTPIKVRTGKC